jgi:hypothetical protein
MESFLLAVGIGTGTAVRAIQNDGAA